MNTATLAHLNAVIPELILILAALTNLLVGAYRSENFFKTSIKVALGATVLALVVQYLFLDASGAIFTNMLVVNTYTSAVKLLILVATAAVLWMSLAYYDVYSNHRINEYSVIVLLAVVGLMFLVSANHMLSFYISLELSSIAGYLLASMHRNDSKSSEAGLKYFILGSLASGLLLFGLSFVYGFTGAADFNALTTVLQAQEKVSIGVLIGIVLVIIAMSFKMSAAPFHMWTPDVYQGAPTIVTTFFASVPKLALMAFMVRLLMEPFVSLADQWQQIVVAVSMVSMVIGALGAIGQTNIKRLLAYSSIGHVGYMLIGIATAEVIGIRAVFMYMSVYVVTVLGTFAMVMMLADKEGDREDISVLSGLSKTQPFLAFSILVLMLSLAGIPPLAGFFVKFYIFMAAVEKGLMALAVVGVLSSVVAAFYYLRIIKMMYFDESAHELVKRDQKELKSTLLAVVLINLFLFLCFSTVINASIATVQSLF